MERQCFVGHDLSLLSQFVFASIDLDPTTRPAPLGAKKVLDAPGSSAWCQFIDVCPAE